MQQRNSGLVRKKSARVKAALQEISRSLAGPKVSVPFLGLTLHTSSGSGHLGMLWIPGPTEVKTAKPNSLWLHLPDKECRNTHLSHLPPRPTTLQTGKSHTQPWLTCSQLLISISSGRRRFPGKNGSYLSCQRECPDGALGTFSSRDCRASPPAQPQNGSLALPASPAPLGVVLGTLCTGL